MLPTAPTSNWQHRLAAFPIELKVRRIWCVWQPQEREGKLTKVPLAKSNDASTWTTFEQACNTADAVDDLGVGVLCDGEYSFIDLDKCITDGIIAPWAQAVLARTDSYAELSPSGTGLHIFVKGAVSKPAKKSGCEIYSTARFFTVTGHHVAGTPLTVAALSEELEQLRQDIVDDHVRPKSDSGKIRSSIIAVRPNVMSQSEREAKLERALAGDISDYPSRSEAVHGVLQLLARKHQGDREDIQEAFEASPLCGLWGEKWSRLCEPELDKAIAAWEENGSPKWEETPEKPKTLEFTRPTVPGGDHDYLLGPLPDDWMPEGMFPCGEISLVGGSSGAGKSTLLYDILARQTKCEAIFDRATYNRSYLIVLQDRSQRSARLTFARLGLGDSPNVHVLTAEEAAQPVAHAIKNLVEARDPMPQVVVIEGLDMYTPDQSKMDAVVASLGPLQRVAEHYHIAIIGTVGSPKLKVREEFINDRDKVFGSVAWSRRSETIWTLQTQKEKERVALTMMPRHNKRQELLLEWQQGRLVEVTDSMLESEQKSDVLEWVLEQERFTKQQLRKQFGLSGESAKKRLEGLTAAKVLQSRPIGGKVVYVVRHPAVETVNSAEVAI